VIDWTRNDPSVGPGDPYPFQGGTNPLATLLSGWTVEPAPDSMERSGGQDRPVPGAWRADTAFRAQFYAGTTSIEASDAEGWVVSVTPSGG
jgi:gamma-glutamyltranspeptidase/glutathione hydrolase